MRPSHVTTQIMGTTAIALLLLGAPLTLNIDQGLQIAPARAWAESERGDDHGGGHEGGDHGDSHESGSDHGSGGDDHGSGGGHGNGSDDGTRAQSQDQDRLEQGRDEWLGVPDQSQGGDAQAGNGNLLVPVPEDQERQLIERGWASDDAEGDHQ